MSSALWSRSDSLTVDEGDKTLRNFPIKSQPCCLKTPAKLCCFCLPNQRLSCGESRRGERKSRSRFYHVSTCVSCSRFPFLAHFIPADESRLTPTCRELFSRLTSTLEYLSRLLLTARHLLNHCLILLGATGPYLIYFIGIPPPLPHPSRSAHDNTNLVGRSLARLRRKTA
jgi:hypothetical protein